jgi:hypothetical protein
MTILNFILAISITGQILIAQRKPEHDTIPRLTQEQQEDVDLAISACLELPPERRELNLECQFSYEELIDNARYFYPSPTYDRPNLCDKFQGLSRPWTQQEYTEYTNLKCSIGN